jgi:hypothetical protein
LRKPEAIEGMEEIGNDRWRARGKKGVKSTICGGVRDVGLRDVPDQNDRGDNGTSLSAKASISEIAAAWLASYGDTRKRGLDVLSHLWSCERSHKLNEKQEWDGQYKCINNPQLQTQSQSSVLVAPSVKENTFVEHGIARRKNMTRHHHRFLIAPMSASSSIIRACHVWTSTVRWSKVVKIRLTQRAPLPCWFHSPRRQEDRTSGVWCAQLHCIPPTGAPTKSLASIFTRVNRSINLGKVELQWVVHAQADIKADIEPRLEKVRQGISLVRNEESVVAERAHGDADLFEVEQVL